MSALAQARKQINRIGDGTGIEVHLKAERFCFLHICTNGSKGMSQNGGLGACPQKNFLRSRPLKRRKTPLCRIECSCLLH